MNIKQAKEQVKNTVKAYLAKDEHGRWLVPVVAQRPILLMGPPGVGKTAIAQQAAQECGVALVSYTMTHHTRQSAIGLPSIHTASYGDKTFQVTEYTMSEIIASVYRAMEETGLKTGILFLDEVNCVSETLAPAMLQFLQCKTFGGHTLPEGWVIVAAGNPPEYNRSVRDFDIVTLDRVRRLDIQAAYQPWKEYAYLRQVSPVIMAYLELKPQNFYKLETTVDGKRFATARGWEDLSRLLQSYESLGIPVEEALVGEFLNLEETSRDFYDYYRLYGSYGRDYGVREILAGEADTAFLADRKAMAQAGDFTERFALVNLILEQLRRYAAAYGREDALDVALHETMQAFFRQNGSLEDFLAARRNALQTKRQFRLESADSLTAAEGILRKIEQWGLEAKQARCGDGAALERFLKARFDGQLESRQGKIRQMTAALDRAIPFLTDCFGDGQELTLLITGITGSKGMMAFIARHGSDSYLALCGRLQCQKNEAQLQELCRRAVEKK